MKASGNGAPEICVQNLLKTIRGEVPYVCMQARSSWAASPRTTSPRS